MRLLAISVVLTAIHVAVWPPWGLWWPALIVVVGLVALGQWAVRETRGESNKEDG